MRHEIDEFDIAQTLSYLLSINLIGDEIEQFLSSSSVTRVFPFNWPESLEERGLREAIHRLLLDANKLYKLEAIHSKTIAIVADSVDLFIAKVNQVIYANTTCKNEASDKHESDVRQATSETADINLKANVDVPTEIKAKMSTTNKTDERMYSK